MKRYLTWQNLLFVLLALVFIYCSLNCHDLVDPMWRKADAHWHIR